MQSFVHSAKIWTHPMTVKSLREITVTVSSDLYYVSAERYATLTVVGLLAKNSLCLAVDVCTMSMFLSCMWFHSCGSSNSFLIFILSLQNYFISNTLFLIIISK